MEVDDLPLLFHWLTENQEVRRWYSKLEDATPEALEEKYLPRIRGEVPTHPFLILLREAPIGYIQTYRIADHPAYASYVNVSEHAAGLDLFIGEEEHLHRGLGATILKDFLKVHVFGCTDVASCIVGPEPANRVAIRAYEKAGFQHLKTVHVPGTDGTEYLMRVPRDRIYDFVT